LIWLLCALAALRVFIFSAAFPFFGNVDEAQHFDLVLKYSHARVPRALNPLAPDSARYIAFYGSPEFLSESADFPDGHYPGPFWSQPADAATSVTRTAVALQKETNYEASQPPLYYAVAGAWLRLGGLVGIPQNGYLLYWLRFLNVFLAVPLVWLGYSAARRVFPRDSFTRRAVPLLLAFFPQDTFYSIQNDVLSPLCFGAVFCCLVGWLQTDAPSLRLALLTGLATAATCLTKTANLPLLAVVVLAVLWHARGLAGAGRLRAALPAHGVLALSASLPLALWFAWNLRNFGDLTASGAKIQHLDWTRKPLSQWWPHPLFTFHGLKAFWSGLLTTFWRGELTWHGTPMMRPAADAFYWVSSALFLTLASLSLVLSSFSFWKSSVVRAATKITSRVPPRGELSLLPTADHRSLWLSLFAFVLHVAFFALLSLAFDFGKCPYPSRAYPYFVSGRLLTAVLIPFFLLYCHGLDWTLTRLRAGRLHRVVMTGIILLLVVSEILINSPAFGSAYNFFHLRSWLHIVLS
jgi:hypothetical protein